LIDQQGAHTNGDNADENDQRANWINGDVDDA